MKHYVDLEGYVRCQDCGELSQNCHCDECQNCLKLQTKLDKALEALKCLLNVAQDGRVANTRFIMDRIKELETVEE